MVGPPWRKLFGVDKVEGDLVPDRRVAVADVLDEGLGDAKFHVRDKEGEGDGSRPPEGEACLAMAPVGHLYHPVHPLHAGVRPDAHLANPVTPRTHREPSGQTTRQQPLSQFCVLSDTCIAPPIVWFCTAFTRHHSRVGSPSVGTGVASGPPLQQSCAL